VLKQDASPILITDSVRYLLIRRVSDDVDETYQAHFQLSLPLGNRGILDLDSPESDLSPAFVRPPSLCHKPFGLWLALSFDDPDPNADDSPVKQRERPPPGKRPRTSGSRLPSDPTTHIRLRSEGTGRAHGGVVRGRGRGQGRGRGHGVGQARGIGRKNLKVLVIDRLSDSKQEIHQEVRPSSSWTLHVGKSTR